MTLHPLSNMRILDWASCSCGMLNTMNWVCWITTVVRTANQKIQQETAMEIDLLAHDGSLHFHVMSLMNCSRKVGKKATERCKLGVLVRFCGFGRQNLEESWHICSRRKANLYMGIGSRFLRVVGKTTMLRVVVKTTMEIRLYCGKWSSKLGTKN